MTAESMFERFDAIHRDLAALVEEFGESVFYAIESDTLKRVAIAAGVDHTREGTWVIEQLGVGIQRRDDLIRELRRHVAALERRRDGAADGETT